MPDTATAIQYIIQGGAVGIALVVVMGAYRIVRRSMELVNLFVTNHIAHLTESIDNNTKTVTLAIEENSQVLTRLDETITAMNRRM